MVARPPLPASCWLLDSAPLLLSRPLYALLPSAIHFTLKMEAARSSKKLVSYHKITQHHNPEDFNLFLLQVQKMSSKDYKFYKFVEFDLTIQNALYSSCNYIHCKLLYTVKPVSSSHNLYLTEVVFTLYRSIIY
jgi:hypothetical protein